LAKLIHPLLLNNGGQNRVKPLNLKECRMKRNVDLLCYWLLIIGGLNWAFVGLFDWNLITYLFRVNWIINVAYVVIGLAAVYFVVARKHIVKYTKR